MQLKVTMFSIDVFWSLHKILLDGKGTLKQVKEIHFNHHKKIRVFGETLSFFDTSKDNFVQPFISQLDLRRKEYSTLNAFNARFQKKYSGPQLAQLEVRFNILPAAAIPTEKLVYALVSTHYLSSISSDVQKHFDFNWFWFFPHVFVFFQQ